MKPLHLGIMSLGYIMAVIKSCITMHRLEMQNSGGSSFGFWEAGRGGAVSIPHALSNRADITEQCSDTL